MGDESFMADFFLVLSRYENSVVKLDYSDVLKILRLELVKMCLREKKSLVK